MPFGAAPDQVKVARACTEVPSATGLAGVSVIDMLVTAAALKSEMFVFNASVGVESGGGVDVDVGSGIGDGVDVDVGACVGGTVVDVGAGGGLVGVSAGGIGVSVGGTVVGSTGAVVGGSAGISVATASSCNEVGVSAAVSTCARAP